MGSTHTVVPSTHTVVVCVMNGWSGEPLITVGLLMMFYGLCLGATDTVIQSTHTMVVCGMKGWRGEPLISVGLLKLFSNRGTLGKNRGIKVVFQLFYQMY